MPNARKSLWTSLCILTSLFVSASLAQQKSQDLDTVMKPLMGSWYGKVFRGKSILPLPEGGAPIQLKFEKSAGGDYQGVIQANSQGGKITELKWQDETKTLTGKTQFLNIALKVELKPEGKKLKGRITGIGINMPLEVGRQAPTIQRITLSQMTAEKWQRDAEFLRTQLPKVGQNQLGRVYLKQ